MSNKSKMGMATILAMAGMLGGIDAISDLTGPAPEEKGEPRPDEVDHMSRRARKVYARMMRDTGNRDAALSAAKAAETGFSIGIDPPLDSANYKIEFKVEE